MYAFKRYYEDYRMSDILVYESPMDIPDKLPSDFKPTTSNVIKALAKNNLCYVWELKSCPSMSILIYETDDTISDNVRILYKLVNKKELTDILKKYK